MTDITLSGAQRKYLRGLAHGLKPVVIVGQNGVSDALIQSTDTALTQHELIKVKFNGYKDKPAKTELSALIESRTSSELVGMIGHTAIFFRANKDPEKRRIQLP
jgi:RNA-binding protein